MVFGLGRSVAPSGLALALALVGCGQTTQLEIPIANWPGYEYFHLAHEQRLDRDLGLEIRTLGFPDPQDIVEAYEQGRFVFAQLTTVEVVDICSRVPERCPVVVLILDESRGGDKVAVRPAIGTLEALRGKRVGMTPSTLGPYVLSRALATKGMGLADVRTVAMPLADMGRRLASGEIDGAAFFPPFSDEVLASGKAVEVFSSARIPGEIFDVLVVDPTYYQQHVATLAKLLKVWQQAHDLARRDPQSVEIMASRVGLTAQAFRETERGLVYHSLAQQRPMLKPDGPLARNLAAVLAVQQQLGLIPAQTSLPRVANAPLEQALQ